MTHPSSQVAEALRGLNDLDRIPTGGADPPVAEVQSELQRHEYRSRFARGAKNQICTLARSALMGSPY
jgi:hypothetical protein